MMNSFTYKSPTGGIPQFTNRVIAIRPTCFKVNEETIKDNVFQTHSPDSTEKQTIKVTESAYKNRHKKSMTAMLKI